MHDESNLGQIWFRIQLLISCRVDFETYEIKDLESKHIGFELKLNVSAISFALRVEYLISQHQIVANEFCEFGKIYLISALVANISQQNKRCLLVNLDQSY